MPRFEVFLIAMGVVIVGLVGAVLISTARLDRANARLVAELLAIASPESERVFRGMMTGKGYLNRYKDTWRMS